MLLETTIPCSLCGRLPKMYATRFRGEPEGFVLSCVGDKHIMSIFKIGTPEETVAEWDRRMKAGPAADEARAELRDREARQEQAKEDDHAQG